MSNALPESPREVLALSAMRFPDHDALHIPLSACQHYSSQEITLSYSELEGAIAQATEIWRQTGVTGRVALMLENRPEFFIQWHALNALGISVIPINHEMPDAEIPYYLEHGEAVAVLTLDVHCARLVNVVDALKVSIPVISPDQVSTLDFGSVPATPVATDGSNCECALLYTSGSTGKPKGCLLNNDYFLQQGIWYQNLGGHIALREGDERLLTPLPLSHMNAMSVSTMAMFMTGGCLIQLDRFHPGTWWQSLRESRATAIHYLGVLPAILLALPEEPLDDFSTQIRFGFGAGVNPAHHKRFEKRFGFPLIEAWAMTECGAGGAIIASNEPRHVGHCCFGKPPEAMEWQLVDEQKLPVDKGTPGELRVRAQGPNPQKGYFSGYLKNSEATADAWADGWLNTGDVVVELEDGNLAFVDRRKNIIRRSGENISALEIEAALGDHPAIKSAVATAVPDEMRGDEVALCVILKPLFEGSLD
ncbi:MAG: AMP-binding protein, partial [Luminiphilus sp.]|nr:AMP-binding protein [Luminiphilus sp.]